MENEITGKKGGMVYPYPIHKNAIPNYAIFEENGDTKKNWSEKSKNPRL